MDTRWTSTTKLLILISLLVVGAWLLVQFAQIIPPLLVAIIIAYLLKPPTDWLVRSTGWPRGLAVLVLFLIILLLIVLTPVLVTPGVAALIRSIDFDVTALDPIWQRLASESLHIGPFEIVGSEVVNDLTGSLQSIVTPFASGALQFVSGVATSLFYLLFIIVLVFWLLKDSYKLESWFIEHIRPSYREEIRHLFQELGLIWGSFFRGELVLAVVVGTLVGLSMWILGLPNVFVLALISGFMEFIPTIGPVIAAIPGILIALFVGSSWLAVNPIILGIIVAVIYTIIFQVEQIYLLPRIVGRRVRLHPGVVFVGTVIGATQIGVLGVLIAAPVIASVRLFGGYVYRKLFDLEPFTSLPGAQAATIEWRGIIRGQAIAGILFDLDGTLIETDDHMIERIAARFGPLQRLFPQRDARPFVRRLVLLFEGPINWLIGQFDRVDLDDEAFRLNDWIRKMLGYRPVADMQVVPGALETLAELQSGYKLALVTTRNRPATEHFLGLTGLGPYFEAVVCADDVRRLKPHPEPVLLAAEQLGLEPGHCVMVGDTAVDMLAARAAGARSVAVLSGFGESRELEEADLVIDSLAELTAWL